MEAVARFNEQEYKQWVGGGTAPSDRNSERVSPPYLQGAVQVCRGGGDDALTAHPYGDMVEQRLRQLLLHWKNL